MRAIKNIIGSVFISIAALAFWVFILPGYEMQSYLKSSIDIKSSALDSKTQLIQKVADLNKEYQEKFNELKRLSLVVPSEKNIAEIITTLEDISSISGVNLSEMAITDGGGSSNLKDYNVVNLGFSFSGSYESILDFINHIESHIRLIDPTAISMGIKEDESSASQVVLTADLKANAYFLTPIKERKVIIRSQLPVE